MDYILKEIDKKIDFHSGMGEKEQLKTHYQARSESC